MTLPLTDWTVNWSGAVVGLEVEVPAVHTLQFDTHKMK